MHEVNIPQGWLDLLINSVKWSERGEESEWTQREKKDLKVFPVICPTGRKKTGPLCKLHPLVSLFFCWKKKPFRFFFLIAFYSHFYYPTSFFLFLCDCWLSTLVLHWVRGHTQDLYTIFGLGWLILLDTVSSISPSHIILVMQKSSGPGIAWGLSSGNPNNFNPIEFLWKNAKINEWIKLLLCLSG